MYNVYFKSSLCKYTYYGKKVDKTLIIIIIIKWCDDVVNVKTDDNELLQYKCNQRVMTVLNTHYN